LFIPVDAPADLQSAGKLSPTDYKSVGAGNRLPTDCKSVGAGQGPNSWTECTNFDDKNSFTIPVYISVLFIFEKHFNLLVYARNTPVSPGT
jgi:hypothetical protein